MRSSEGRWIEAGVRYGTRKFRAVGTNVEVSIPAEVGVEQLGAILQGLADELVRARAAGERPFPPVDHATLSPEAQDMLDYFWRNGGACESASLLPSLPNWQDALDELETFGWLDRTGPGFRLRTRFLDR